MLISLHHWTNWGSTRKEYKWGISDTLSNVCKLKVKLNALF